MWQKARERGEIQNKSSKCIFLVWCSIAVQVTNVDKNSRGYYDIFCVFKTCTIDTAVKAMCQDGCKAQQWKKTLTALEQWHFQQYKHYKSWHFSTTSQGSRLSPGATPRYCVKMRVTLYPGRLQEIQWPEDSQPEARNFCQESGQ